MGNKTEVSRRCPLWPETVAALQAWLKKRPRKSEPHVFTRKKGGLWVEVSPAMDHIGAAFRYLARTLGIENSFYDLRRTFRTIADGARDTPAIDLIMGHSDGSMGATYRQFIEDSRLVAVCEVVRKWLFG